MSVEKVINTLFMEGQTNKHNEINTKNINGKKYEIFLRKIKNTS